MSEHKQDAPIAEDLRAQYAELKYRKTRGWCHSEVDDRKFLDPLQLIERTSAAEQRERVLRKEIRTLRYTINPNTLESLIRDGKVPVGDGVLPWVSKDSPLGLDGLLSNVEVGNDVLAEGVAEEINAALAAEQPVAPCEPAQEQGKEPQA